MDAFTVTDAGYYQELDQYVDAAPLQGQHADVAPQGYQQQPDPQAPVPPASGTQVMESRHGASSSVLGKRPLTEPEDPEEAAGDIVTYTCPYLACPFSNYALGFNSRVKRNSHMAFCLYGNGVVYEHVPADGQMPSAPYINDWVEEFARNAAVPNQSTNNNNAVQAPAAEPAGMPLNSLDTFVAPPASQVEVAPNMNPQVVEPAYGAGLHQLPEQPAAIMTAFEHNDSNISNIAEVTNNDQPSEVTTQDVFQPPAVTTTQDVFQPPKVTTQDVFQPPQVTTTQDVFQPAAEIGGSSSGNLEGLDLTATDASQPNVSLGMIGAHLTDYDWLLDYPPHTWKFLRNDD